MNDTKDADGRCLYFLLFAFHSAVFSHLTYVYVYFLLFPSFLLPFLLNAHLLADHARTGKPGHPAPSPRSSQKIDHCTYRATPPTDHATQYPGINTK